MNKGFTLIELMTTISVIAIISAVVFADFSGTERRLALKQAAYRVAQDIRETEQMALGGVNANCGGLNFCGFGLEFDPLKDTRSYWLFADCENDCSAGIYKRDSNDTVVKAVLLSKGIEIKTVSPVNLNVVFSPPDPVVNINKVAWGTEAEITLKTSKDETRKVRVNSAGRIEVE